MRKSHVFAGILGFMLAFICCMLFVHRRVIRAVALGEPVPEAPAWHFWVNNRKKASNI